MNTIGQSPGLLFGNPIVRREWRAFLRRAYLWIPALLIIWVPMTWLTRLYVQNLTTGIMTPVASEALHSLAMAFRPDVLVAMILVQNRASRGLWHHARDEYAVTMLTPSRLLLGKVIVPVTLISIFHLCGAGYYYSDLLQDPWYIVRLMDDGPAFHAGVPIIVFALVEDLLFGIVAVMIAARVFLLETDVLKASLRAAVRLFLIGALVYACNFAWSLILLVLPVEWQWWLLTEPGRFMLASNAVWFATIIPAELMVIAFLWWRTTRRLTAWLQPRE